MSQVLAIDLGTGGPKVALVSFDGEIVAAESEPVATLLGAGGAVEQRPQDWWAAIVRCTRRIVGAWPEAAGRVAAVAVTGQWAGTVATGAGGEPLAAALTWLDSRGAPHVRRAVAGGPRVAGYGAVGLARWVRLTGGAPSLSGRDPLGHILYLKAERPDVYEATETFLEPVDWLGMRLTGRRSASFDTITMHWVTDTRRPTAIGYDERLLRMAGIPREKLPELRPSASVIGPLSASAAAELGLGGDAHVVTATPDTMSAAVGSGAVGDHAAHLYVGTSSWLSCHVPYKKTDPLHAIASLPAALPGRYLVSCEQQTAGACLARLRDEWLAGAGGYDELTALAARAPAGSGGVLFMPWLNGERTPVDDHRARGGWLGLALDTSRAQLVRSVLEGVALNARWMQQHVERFCRRRLDPVTFVGGGARSPLWCQIFADVLGREIRAAADPVHANVRGAALLAGLALGELRLEEIPRRVPIAATYEPDEATRATYDRLFAELVRAYRATRPIYRRLSGRTEAPA